MKKLSFFLLFISLLSFDRQAYASAQSVAIQSLANIPVVLELTISQTGASELRFGNLQPSAIDATEAGPISVIIDVKSNVGSRYQVDQTISGPLTSASGDEIAVERLKFTTASGHNIGSPVASPTSMTSSAQTIYSSDNQGTSDSIRADYKLTVPASQAPGDYSARITYTVSSL